MKYNQMIQVHIADLHFGAVDPATELKLLTEQFLQPISRISFSILSINGDIFDRRYPANHPAISAAIEFINRCAMMCSIRKAALILISGTDSHDAGQLSLFKDLHNTTGAEIYVVDHIQFVHTHGVKILCIPEEYNKGAAYYDNFLKESYDFCFLHGTIVGGVPMATEENLDSKREPVFSLDCFSGCKGPIIAGHVHTAMCLNSYMYYCSSPMRWRFGEEQEKGYGILITDLNTFAHHYEFMPIQSFSYKTISIEDMDTTNVEKMYSYINYLLENGVDHLRVRCDGIPEYQLRILQETIRNAKNANRVKLTYSNSGSHKQDMFMTEEAEETNLSDTMKKMKFILDSNIDSFTKFVLFLNLNEGSEYMTVDRLKAILASD